jgi:hypothetical protein
VEKAALSSRNNKAKDIHYLYGDDVRVERHMLKYGDLDHKLSRIACYGHAYFPS